MTSTPADRLEAFIHDLQMIIAQGDAANELLTEIATRLKVVPSEGTSITREDILKRIDSVMFRLSVVK